MSQTSFTTSTVSRQPDNGGGGASARGWALTLCLMGLAVFVCLDAWLDIARIVQRDEEASHILLVPLVFARIVWVRRKDLSDWVPASTLWGIAIVLLGISLWLLGYIKAMQVVWHFGAVVTMFGAFVSVNGLDIVKRLWPAFLVLCFLMPLPGMIRQPLALFLQNASAQATEFVIIALGFELTRHTNLLVINDYTVGIAEACNGMRMVSMLILIVFAFVFSENIRTWVRVVLILLSVPLAILCNIFRLVPTVLAYGYVSPGLAEQIHDWLGWGLAFASYFGLMGLLWVMRWLLLPVDPKPGDRRWRSRRIRRGQPSRFSDIMRFELSSAARMFAAVGGVLVVLGSAHAIGRSLPDGSESEAYHARIREVAQLLSDEVGSWKAVEMELPQAAVALLRPNVLISRRYEDKETGRSFSMLVVQCSDIRDMEGHYPPNCYPSSGWTALGEQPHELQFGELTALSQDYSFERISDSGLSSIAVVNLIAVPREGFVTSMQHIRRLAGTVTDRYYGAAQIQFVFDENWDRSERLKVVEEVGETLKPLLIEILGKTGREDELGERP